MILQRTTFRGSNPQLWYFPGMVCTIELESHLSDNLDYNYSDAGASSPFIITLQQNDAVPPLLSNSMLQRNQLGHSGWHASTSNQYPQHNATRGDRWCEENHLTTSHASTQTPLVLQPPIFNHTCCSSCAKATLSSQANRFQRRQYLSYQLWGHSNFSSKKWRTANQQYPSYKWLGSAKSLRLFNCFFRFNTARWMHQMLSKQLQTLNLKKRIFFVWSFSLFSFFTTDFMEKLFLVRYLVSSDGFIRSNCFLEMLLSASSWMGITWMYPQPSSHDTKIPKTEMKNAGGAGNRTQDLIHAKDALYQLSHAPIRNYALCHRRKNIAGIRC